MGLNFKRFAEEGEHFVKGFAEQMGYPGDRNRAARVLRSVLHTLRELITPEENVEFLAQLPMFLKAVYVEGWTFRHQDGRIRDFEQLVSATRLQHGVFSERDFQDDEEVEKAFAVMFLMLRRYVSLGELEDIRAVLPKQLKPILNQVLML